MTDIDEKMSKLQKYPLWYSQCTVWPVTGLDVVLAGKFYPLLDDRNEGEEDSGTHR